uniref:Uncharacterized protein n=1 Tax=Anguilla anguilla TaxID=7936 RepID=A0A0E9X6D0_ANGAN
MLWTESPRVSVTVCTISYAVCVIVSASHTQILSALRGSVIKLSFLQQCFFQSKHLQRLCANTVAPPWPPPLLKGNSINALDMDSVLNGVLQVFILKEQDLLRETMLAVPRLACIGNVVKGGGFKFGILWRLV